MARRVEPPMPGSDAGVREQARVLPALDLSAPAIIGVRVSPDPAPAPRPPAMPPADLLVPQRPADPPAAPTEVRQRQHRQAGELENVPAANSVADVALLGRVREGLIELPGAAAAPAGAGDEGLSAVRDTFAMVSAAGDMAAAYFYGWLFTARPELRDLFPPAMDEQRDRLFAALTRIVGAAGAPGPMRGYLAQLGRDHRKYSVSSDMYEAVGSALFATLRAFAGRALTPAAEQAWAATYKLVSGVMIGAAEEASETAPAFWTAKVVRHHRPVRGIAVLTVAPQQPLPYQAGQHVTVQTRRWPKAWRPYSVAGRPRGDGLLSFHVRAVSGGWVSTALVEHTSVGDDLILGPAVGDMTLPPAGSRDLLCVAGGTGLAPLKAIIEQVVCTDSRLREHRGITLYCGARSECELYDLRSLYRLCDVYPWLRVHPVISDDPAFQGLRGAVGEVAAERLPHADCEAYVAGPPGMVSETTGLLGNAGLPAERIHFDAALLSARCRAAAGT